MAAAQGCSDGLLDGALTLFCRACHDMALLGAIQQQEAAGGPLGYGYESGWVWRDRETKGTRPGTRHKAMAVARSLRDGGRDAQCSQHGTSCCSRSGLGSSERRLRETTEPRPTTEPGATTEPRATMEPRQQLNRSYHPSAAPERSAACVLNDRARKHAARHGPAHTGTGTGTGTAVTAGPPDGACPRPVRLQRHRAPPSLRPPRGSGRADPAGPEAAAALEQLSPHSLWVLPSAHGQGAPRHRSPK